MVGRWSDRPVQWIYFDRRQCCSNIFSIVTDCECLGQRDSANLMFPLNIISASGVRVALIGANLTDFNIQSASEVKYRLNTNGNEQTRVGIGAAFITIGTWLKSGDAADFECRYAAVGDETEPQLINVWRDMGASNNTFGYEPALAVREFSSGTIEIRRKIDNAVLASAALSLEAEIDDGS